MWLSVIIPIYNAEEYLDECIASIIADAADHGGIEVLLLDDGSTDDSLTICQKYKSPLFRVFHHENHGVSYTRNRGIQEASGDYIMFVDADDRLLPEWKRIVYEGVRLGCDVVYFSDKITNSKASRQDVIDSIFGVLKTDSLGNMASPCSRLFRRDHLLKNAICFDENLINGEDAIFNLSVITTAASYALIAKPIYQYRIDNQSASRRYDPRFYASNLEYLRLAENILTETQAVPPQRIEQYLAHSFCYSVYLLLFRISKLQSKARRREELCLFSTPEMQRLFKAHCDYKDENGLYRFFFWLALHDHLTAAAFFMSCVNKIRKARKGGRTWETM